jgi:HPt (histidine-containing phosphotransfer) domain-containing protein
MSLVRRAKIPMSVPVPILDHDLALTRVGGDPELLREIACLFLDNYQAWLSELRDAAKRGDATRVEHTAHGLKGSVANFGAEPAVNAAREIETLGHNRDLAQVDSSLKALEAALAALRPELEAL